MFECLLEVRQPCRGVVAVALFRNKETRIFHTETPGRFELV